ncbi:unnamed protein product [Periconia digitata]|uniref:Uncharacterized protein n=1 Tax=Periconia digitata TaxID=1303443 RepID=A0A9W4U9Q0_9PLEO|nr:unnamed protein product [Periconia digitata]
MLAVFRGNTLHTKPPWVERRSDGSRSLVVGDAIIAHSLHQVFLGNRSHVARRFLECSLRHVFRSSISRSVVIGLVSIGFEYIERFRPVWLPPSLFYCKRDNIRATSVVGVIVEIDGEILNVARIQNTDIIVA